MSEAAANRTDTAEIVFREGIIGVPRARRFLLLEREDSAIRCLSCLDIKGFSLPVVDPFMVDGAYAPRMGSRVNEALETSGSDPILMLAIANVEPGQVVANLRAPLLINVRRQLGVQIILDDAGLSLRTPVRMESAQAEAQTVGS